MEKFALKTKDFTSKYLTKEDREQMILDLYKSEKNSDAEISKSVLKEIQEKLSFLAVTDQSKFPWQNFLESYANRKKYDDFVEIVARDLLLIEHTNKLYKKINEEQISENEEFESNLDKTALKLAKYLYEFEVKKGHL